MGAWIEIDRKIPSLGAHQSLPLWERGLKSVHSINLRKQVQVAPLVGAWIEIFTFAYPDSFKIVAPLVGAWIEIAEAAQYAIDNIVAPLVGAWIEIAEAAQYAIDNIVAPLVGAWIEIQSALSVLQKAWVAPLVGAWIEIHNNEPYKIKSFSRSPCGSVD